MTKLETQDWSLIYTDWNPPQQPLREALCTLGNGYIATRGAFEEVHAGGHHYPGTYLAGGYNRLETDLAGRVLENEDLVNWPNWLLLNFRPEGGEWFNLNTVDLLDFRCELNVNRGILERDVCFRDTDDREFSLISRRFVHMAHPHLAAIEWQLTALNWSGTIEIQSAIDGTVTNQNVDRYRQLNGQHLKQLETGFDGEDGIFLSVQTNQSHIQMTEAARSRVYVDHVLVPTQRIRETEHGRISHRLLVDCHQHQTLRIEKIVAIYTSRDYAISEPTLAARQAIRRAPNFSTLCQSHALAWQHLWSIADIVLQNGHSATQLILRLHIFHLLQTTSPNTIGHDVGVPARGWHGEAYRGHIFWDELFIFPFITLRLPKLTRSLLMYRYRRLPEAKHRAHQAGYDGAMFPWQSGSDGREESQSLHLNPQSGRWLPDDSQLQRHVNAAIAYNIWQYYQVTHDLEFLSHYGAELLLEIARFWASLVTYNAARNRYEIHHVIGPDEFHTQYPDAAQPGLNNNAYTNCMASWVLRCASTVLNLLDEARRSQLIERLDINDEELLRWDSISRNMLIPWHDEGIISQFEGYETLKEFDWEHYAQKGIDLQRLDRILEAEKDDVNAYKVSKQADVLMLFYLFSAEALQELFEHMGYRFDPEMIQRNIEYYIQRTSHGSTLSRIVHSWVLARADRERSWKLFEQALRSDIDDIQGGTTSEGIHLGAMASTIDMIQRVYTGLEMRDDVLWLNPFLPNELSDIRLRIHYHGHWLSLHLSAKQLTVSFERGGSQAAQIGFRGQVYKMLQGETQAFSLE